MRYHLNEYNDRHGRFIDKDKSKRIIMNETLSQSCSANEEESKQSIVNKTLLQNYYANVDELRSTKEDIMEQKDTEIEGYI